MSDIDTLGALKAHGYALTANCTRPGCGRGRKLDLDMLIGRLGPDYDIINDTRIGAACRCEACGYRGATITLSKDTGSPNPYAAASGR